MTDEDYMKLLDEMGKLNRQNWELRDQVRLLESRLAKREEQLVKAQEDVGFYKARAEAAEQALAALSVSDSHKLRKVVYEMVHDYNEGNDPWGDTDDIMGRLEDALDTDKEKSNE